MRTNQEAISLLLATTAGIPHGRYPEWQEDDDGNVWEFLDTMNEPGARALLDGIFPAMHHVADAFMPENREFIIYRADNTYVYAIYRTDYRYHILRATGKRFYQRELRSLGSRTGAYHSLISTMKDLYSHQLETDWHVNVA
jgi:hypothetical protein